MGIWVWALIGVVITVLWILVANRRRTKHESEFSELSGQLHAILTHHSEVQEIADRHAILSAAIDISESYNVEFVYSQRVDPLDLVQIAISYVGNVIYCTYPPDPLMNSGLTDLASYLAHHDVQESPDIFRQKLKALASNPHYFQANGTRFPDRYWVRLIRGTEIGFDYTVTEFSQDSDEKNMIDSTLYLYVAVAEKVPDDYLKVLEDSFIYLIQYFKEYQPEISNSQYAPYRIVRQVAENYLGSNR